MSEQIIQRSVKQLLTDGTSYLIPMYQRNYAWGEGEITQLLQDIIDYMPSAVEAKKNYYIGTLVVFERKVGKGVVYEVIDGQQRLTTLSLLVSYLKNECEDTGVDWYTELKIGFESREHSTKTFSAIFDNKLEGLKPCDTNTSILDGYEMIEKLFKQKLKDEKVELKAFAEFLFNQVQIMRVKVPEDTDLNHYFEIMNNRGEQLEKHEVLKSKMMEVLNEITNEADKQVSLHSLHTVWEACANMEKYVQYGFTPEQRHTVFGKNDWGKFELKSFDDLCDVLKPLNEGDFDKDVSAAQLSQSLDDIITKPLQNIKETHDDEDAPDRFNAVINFPNFLLHVLRVMTKADIPLDDKRLISTFKDELLSGEDAIEQVKKFVFSLLKCKYLFDQFIIKREFIRGTDGWSLKCFKWNDGGTKNKQGRASYVNAFGEDELDGENRQVLMLLSAFHVSTPTLVYKHWLNAALKYLFYAQEVDAKAYLSYLEDVARSFVFDRFLAPTEGLGYFTMIYMNGAQCQRRKIEFTEGELVDKLSFGHIENNLVFNYLDYVLWRDRRRDNGVINSFEFSFRSSVEHYYPQTPMEGQPRMEPRSLNSFGNLCLISHSKNSRLSNFSTVAKKDHYKNNSVDSVKQHLMMNNYGDAKDWNEESVEDHYVEMRDVLLNELMFREGWQ